MVLNTAVAICSWLAMIPFQMIARRWKPEGTDELLAG